MDTFFPLIILVVAENWKPSLDVPGIGCTFIKTRETLIILGTENVCPCFLEAVFHNIVTWPRIRIRLYIGVKEMKSIKGLSRNKFAVKEI